MLADLVASTPGEEGKWFAAAKDAGLQREALTLATRSPCDPRTLTRAARDHLDGAPEFALQAGFLALQWLARGHGYEITGADVWAAYEATLAAARKLGAEARVRQEVRALVSGNGAGAAFLGQVLGKELAK